MLSQICITNHCYWLLISLSLPLKCILLKEFLWLSFISHAAWLLIPSRPYQASLLHPPLPPWRASDGYCSNVIPIAYGEWKTSLWGVTICTSSTLQGLLPNAVSTCTPTLPGCGLPKNPTFYSSYKLKSSSRWFVLFSLASRIWFFPFQLAKVTHLHINLFAFICLDKAIGTFQESGECQLLHKF